MERRNFINAGTVVAGALFLNKNRPLGRLDEKQDAQSRIDKVKRAMLSMQRQAWEQGVASQAILESGGDDELVVLMAGGRLPGQTSAGRRPE